MDLNFYKKFIFTIFALLKIRNQKSEIRISERINCDCKILIYNLLQTINCLLKTKHGTCKQIQPRNC